MKEPSNPDAFPEHLRPYLLPVPETRGEALCLLAELHRAFAMARRERDASDTFIVIDSPLPQN